MEAAAWSVGVAGLRVGELRLLGIVQVPDGDAVTRYAMVLGHDRLSYLLSAGAQLCDG